MKHKKSLFFYVALFSICFLADRVSKWWAVKTLQNQKIVVSDYLNFSLAWNRGISWSLFHYDSSVGFSLLTAFIILVVIVFLIYVFVQYKNYIDVTYQTLVLAGALSNIVDRFWYQAVVDFIQLHSNNWYWPTFNIADVCVIIGILGILITSLYDAYAIKNKRNLF